MVANKEDYVYHEFLRDEELKTKLLDNLGQPYTEEQACNVSGLPYQVYLDWVKIYSDAVREEDFSNEIYRYVMDCKQARSQYLGDLNKQIITNAKNIQAIQLVLHALGAVDASVKSKASNKMSKTDVGKLPPFLEIKGVKKK